MLLTTKLTGGRALLRLDDCWWLSLRFQVQSVEVIVFHNSTAHAHSSVWNVSVFFSWFFLFFFLPTFPQQYSHSVSLLKTQLSIGNKSRLFTFHLGLGFSLPKVVRMRSSFPPRCVMNILSALFQENKKTQVWQNNGTICNYLVDLKQKRNSIGRCHTLLFHDQGVKVWQVSISQFTMVIVVTTSSKSRTER